MLLNSGFGIGGGLLMGLSKPMSSVEVLVLGRLVIGYNCGLYTALVPMYLLEMSPLNLRGGLGTVSQVGVTVGMLLSQILGLPLFLGTETKWPYLLGELLVYGVTHRFPETDCFGQLQRVHGYGAAAGISQTPN